jgi:S-adenosylmethionine synthetase
MVAGEFTTKAKLDYGMFVRGVVAQIGFDYYVDDLPSVDSKGLSDITCEVLFRINKRSPDIAGDVHGGKDEREVGREIRGLCSDMLTIKTADGMALTHSMATRLGKVLTEVRRSGEFWWLRPCGKIWVIIEYRWKADGATQTNCETRYPILFWMRA